MSEAFGVITAVVYDLKKQEEQWFKCCNNGDVVKLMDG
jgi:hypothetical protein